MLHFIHKQRKSTSTCQSYALVLALSIFLSYEASAQCDPSTIDLCDIGKNSIIQACYHAQIVKTSNGYTITGQDLTPSGDADQSVLTSIPSNDYRMPTGVVPVLGAIGGRTQAVFLGSDDKIYAVGEEDLLINDSNTAGSNFRATSLRLPAGLRVCDVSKWEGTAGSGNNAANATGDRDGFLVFSTTTGALYITGDGARAIQQQASNSVWTRVELPSGITAIDFAVGYRTLLVEGSDGKLYASGPGSYLGDGTTRNLNKVTLLATQPNISSRGIIQIQAGFSSYLVLDGDGTIHVLGENSEGGLGVGHSQDVFRWSKVGRGCAGGELINVAYISTLSTHDYRTASSAILVDETIRSWGNNNRQSITSGPDRIIFCPIVPSGNNRNAVAISNGGHISPYININIQICNIGHNKDGAFGDGVNGDEDYGEYTCIAIPGRPAICGTQVADLELTKEANKVLVNIGDTVTFTITVTNRGPDPSSGSLVRDQLSDGFSYVSDNSSGAYNNVTGLWEVGPLEVGATATLTIEAKTLLAGIQTNYAQVIADNDVDRDSTPGDNSTNQDDDDQVEVDVVACPTSLEEILLCPGDSVSILNNWIYEAGSHVETIPTNLDCDSFHITTVRYVEEPPLPQVEIDCENDEYQLSIDAFSAWQVLWDNGDSTNETTYKSSTEIARLTLETAPSCIEQIEISLPPMAAVNELPVFQDTTIKEFVPLKISADLESDEWAVKWRPESIVVCSNCIETEIIAGESTRVTLELEHLSGCTYESSFYLEVEREPEFMYGPNILSTNDPSNEAWQFFTSPNIEIEECTIYDRWGNVVYYNKTNRPIWNGRANGQACEQGVYVYLIQYKNLRGERNTTAGELTLIR